MGNQNSAIKIEIVEVNLNLQSDGTVTLSRDNGDVLAPQPLPDSVWAWNPAGTNGAYERAELQGTVVTYYPAPGFYFQYPIFELRP
jgi:hypothetical protein